MHIIVLVSEQVICSKREGKNNDSTSISGAAQAGDGAGEGREVVRATNRNVPPIPCDES